MRKVNKRDAEEVQTLHEKNKRQVGYMREYELLKFALNGARIFFKSPENAHG